MNKWLVLLGVACCVWPQQASAGLFASDAKVGFDYLNSWLEKRLAGVRDPARNVAEVRSRLHNLGGGPKARRAAEIFVHFMEADRCTDDLLEMARDMAAEKVNLGASRRTEVVMKTKLDEINALCGPYIVDKIEQLYRDTLARPLEDFLRVVVLEPHGWDEPLGAHFEPKGDLAFFSYIGQEESRTLDPERSDWRRALERLAKGDPKAVVYERRPQPREGQFKSIYHRDAFKYAFSTYLQEPCSLLRQTLEEPIKGLYALGDIQRKFDPKSYNDLMKCRTVTVVQLLYGYKVCHNLLNLKSSAINAISLFVNL